MYSAIVVTCLVSDFQLNREETPYFGKRSLTCICNHGKRCDGLLLNVPLRWPAPILHWVQQLEQTLDDRVKVRQKRVSLSPLTKVDQRRGGMSMYPGFVRYQTKAGRPS
jgi:hypothetical protein